MFWPNTIKKEKRKNKRRRKGGESPSRQKQGAQKIKIYFLSPTRDLLMFWWPCLTLTLSHSLHYVRESKKKTRPWRLKSTVHYLSECRAIWGISKFCVTILRLLEVVLNFMWLNSSLCHMSGLALRDPTNTGSISPSFNLFIFNTNHSRVVG